MPTEQSSNRDSLSIRERVARLSEQMSTSINNERTAANEESSSFDKTAWAQSPWGNWGQQAPWTNTNPIPDK